MFGRVVIHFGDFAAFDDMLLAPACDQLEAALQPLPELCLTVRRSGEQDIIHIICWECSPSLI